MTFVHRRDLRQPVTTVLIAVAVLVGCGGTAAASAKAAAATKFGVVALEDCGLGRHLVRPKTLTLSCADGNSLAVDLVWSNWGSERATATGVYTWNTCVPYCAASKTWGRTAARITLSDPVHTSGGWLFEKLTVHITGKAPRQIPRTITLPEAPVASRKAG
jgi:hypothetical protein